jgi:hypothetical protein
MLFADYVVRRVLCIAGLTRVGSCMCWPGS